MTPFDRAWARTHYAEKGYSNNPNDLGGETNHGITLAVARRAGYLGSMRELTVEQAASIAWRWYWRPLRLDDVAQLSEPIAQELFDTYFNGGDPVRMLQRSLNGLNRSNRTPPDYPDVVVDGGMGPATLAALAAFLRVRGAKGELVLMRLLNGLQRARFLELTELRVKNKEFLFGWILNRTADEEPLPRGRRKG